MYPDNFRYTKEHEWVLADGDTGTVGITDHAQQELGDIVYVDLPKVGSRVEAGKSLGRKAKGRLSEVSRMPFSFFLASRGFGRGALLGFAPPRFGMAVLRLRGRT